MGAFNTNNQENSVKTQKVNCLIINCKMQFYTRWRQNKKSMIRITNGVEELFEGTTEDAEKYLKGEMKSNIKPPTFPESRTIKYSGFTFFGFKPTKVKHVFLLIIYLSSMVFSFIIMIGTQNGESVFTKWFAGNIFVIGFAALIRGFIWVIKNWNKEL